MKQANTDTTYCTSKECKKKCSRHITNYSFRKDVAYWFMNTCGEVKTNGKRKFEFN